MSLKHNILYSSLLLLGACGTIFSGSSQTITFDSNIKENIDIYANGALVCTKTPCVVDIDRFCHQFNVEIFRKRRLHKYAQKRYDNR